MRKSAYVLWGAVIAMGLSACTTDPEPRVTVTAAPATETASPAPSPTTSPSPSESPAPTGPVNLLQLGVDYSIEASNTAEPSTDSAGNPVSFEVINVTDGDPNTAWRVSSDYWGSDDYIVIRFDEPVNIESVGLIPGYAKVDPTSGADRFKQNYRLQYVYWTFSDESGWLQEFEDSPEMQTIPVAGETTWIKISNLGVNNDWLDPTIADRPYIAISDIEIIGTVVSAD